MAGGGKALLKFLPEMKVKGEVSDFYPTVRKLILTQSSIWLILLGVSWLASGRIARLYRVEDLNFDMLLILAVGFVLLQLMMSVATKVLQALYETKLLGLVIMGGNVLYVLCLALFLRVFSFGIPGVIIAGGVSNVAMILVIVPKIKLLLGVGVEAGPVPAPGIGKVMKFSLPFVVTGLLNQIVWKQSEVLFLGHYTGMKEAGYFELAYRMPQMVLEFIPLAIWPIIMAGMSESYSKNKKDLARGVRLYYKLLYIIVIPIAAMGFAFSRSVIPILYGDSMALSGLFAQMFFIVFSYSFLYTPLSMSLYVMEKSWVNMLLFSFLAIINIGLDFALIPSYGLWGAFMPVAFVMLLAVVVFYGAIKKLRGDIEVPFRFIGRCYLAGLPTALLAITAWKWNQPVWIGVQIMIGFVVLAMSFRLLKIIGDREKELIMQMPIPFKKIIVSVL
jgi:O-antigen/teichoic acid export membrane protein